jgi:CO dehydrogenase/acetyl-CoA synthase beta subunit
MNAAKIELCIDALAADVADMLAKEDGVTTAESLRRFMRTKTYALLFDAESLLYLESAEYVYDMLKSEQSGDRERWREE